MEQKYDLTPPVVYQFVDCDLKDNFKKLTLSEDKLIN